MQKPKYISPKDDPYANHMTDYQDRPRRKKRKVMTGKTMVVGKRGAKK